MLQFRHGDVILQQVNTLPAGLERLPHAILAHGEQTGHCHRMEPATAVRLFRGAEGKMFLEVSEGSPSLVHEEHGPIALPKGVFAVWRQREYSPQEIRIVRD